MLPFAESRRLTGINPYFTGPGAALEVIGIAADDHLIAGWRRRAAQAIRHLGWDGGKAAASLCVRPHASGASLAMPAPPDQLYTATEVNEWALAATVIELDPRRRPDVEAALQEAWGDGTHPPVIEEAAALRRFGQLAADEARPPLRSLLAAAEAHGVPYLLDGDALTLGEGRGGRTWPLDELPEAAGVPWERLHHVPTAVVTGSNGKTTTTRLIAACCAEQGWTTGYSCTDGVFLAGETLESGDFSGPMGARRVLRDPRTGAAALETARGGILRRGLALAEAGVAVVTNISSDHFGEYGIHDLDALADVKLTVAGLVLRRGALVVNADDPWLRAGVARLQPRFGRTPALAWFAAAADAPLLCEHRARGGATCGPRAGRLLLHVNGADHDLGAIADLPLALGGAAGFNVANLAAAGLAAAVLGVAPGAIARALAGFGRDAAANPGRLIRFDVNGTQVLLDYAHNPASLGGLLELAQRLRGSGRVGLLLGHAGNRADEDLRQVAATAASFRPDLVVVKEIDDYRRGRAPGEVPGILREALLRAGLPAESIELRMSELDAARCALDWARPGDLVVLLVHSPAARAAVLALLEPAGDPAAGPPAGR